MSRTILERDLAFYTGCVETEQLALRRSLPDDEPKHRRRINALQDVVRAISLASAVFKDTDQ